MSVEAVQAGAMPDTTRAFLVKHHTSHTSQKRHNLALYIDHKQVWRLGDFDDADMDRATRELVEKACALCHDDEDEERWDCCVVFVEDGWFHYAEATEWIGA
jgi:hypothetical protein